MDFNKIPAGSAPPWDVNVIIEIPMRGEPVEYGVDAATGGLFVERFLHTAMYYPGNYGFIPHTATADGGPLQALVVGSISVLPGAILRSRPIGVLVLEDGAGGCDSRLLAVPVDRLHPFYAGTTSYRSLPALVLDQIGHFFGHVRDLDPHRHLKVARWGEADEAAQLITEAVQRRRDAPDRQGQGADI
jgi:inorganic pyrophosphatase